MSSIKIWMALLCAFLMLVVSSCSGSTTTIMEEETTTVVEETTIPATQPAGDGEPINIAALWPMSRTGEDGQVLADTVLRLDGVSVLDGHWAVLLQNDDLIHHVTIGVVADSGGGPMPVTDAVVDKQPLCTGSVVLSNGSPESLDLAGGQVQYTIDLQPFQRENKSTEVELTLIGQIDPRLAVISLADQADLQPPTTTTITTTTRQWRREETKEKEGLDGSFGLLGLLGLAFSGNPAGACVNLVCGGAGFDPVDADTIVFVIPPRQVEDPEPEPEIEMDLIGPASGDEGEDITLTILTNCVDWILNGPDGQITTGDGSKTIGLDLPPVSSDTYITYNLVGCGESDDHRILVRDIPVVENLPPVAVATAVPTTGTAPLTVQFDGSSSYDTDGEIVMWQWDYDSDGGGNGSSPSHVFAEPGQYQVVLTVRDDDDATDSTAVGAMTITVVEPTVENLPPVAVLELVGAATGEAPFTVTVNASASYDPDGSIVWYEYFFYGGGGTSRGTNNLTTYSNVYDNPGPYSVWLRVTDNDGAQDWTDTGIQIAVTEPGAEELEAFITPRDAVIQAPDEATFSAVLLNEHGEDVTPLDAVITFSCDESPGSIDPSDGVFYSILSGTGTFTIWTTVTADGSAWIDSTTLTVN